MNSIASRLLRGLLISSLVGGVKPLNCFLNEPIKPV